jgi:UDP-2,4-diacetamido-2,4,6-trideoxy-beta-L-altropyranose hydrolase
MKKKIVFITKASTNDGIGHLQRTVRLARNLNKKKFDLFIIGIKKEYINYLDKKLFKEINFIKNDCQLKIDYLKFEKKINSDLCIIDLPKPNIKLEKKLYQNKTNFLVYDNLSRKKIYSNYLVNLNPVIKKSSYKKVLSYNKCEFLLGVNYFQFNEKKTINKKIKEIKNILLFFGGGKINYNLIHKVSKNISKLNLKKIKIIFISKIKIDKKKKNYLKNRYNLNFSFFHNLRSINNILKKIDLAIVTSGSISFEASFFKVPMILVSVAKNQINIAKSWSKMGAAIYIGNEKVANFSEKLAKGLNKILKVKNRSKMYNIQQRIYKDYQNKLIETLNKI